MQRDTETKKRLANRLRRIQGQVGGLLRMVDEDTYCVDILLQLAAVQGALGKVSQQLLASHVKTCLKDACASAGPSQQQQKLDELVEVFARFRKAP
jgi:DNA-binding FrmR family transcriptional regulator